MIFKIEKKKMKPAHQSDRKLIERYYLNQAGGGGENVFRGTRIQKGHGIGGLFRGLFKSVKPLLKSGMNNIKPILKKGVKFVGQQALDSGMNLASDLLKGRNIKTAARQRAIEARDQLKRKALHSLGPPGKRIKRRKSFNRAKDIFDT